MSSSGSGCHNLFDCSVLFSAHYFILYNVLEAMKCLGLGLCLIVFIKFVLFFDSAA